MTRTLSVAIVGHTNTGKTSLLRTLARDARLGEVADAPGTTRDVRAIDLLAGDTPVLRLFDTPGLEDAIGVAESIQREHASAVDPVAQISAFVASDHAGGQFTQEAKVLRQALAADVLLYVIDARDRARAEHREELRLLAACGHPVLPVLNLIHDPSADAGHWREQLARVGLHISIAFDTVAFDDAAEAQLFDKLAALIEAHAPALRALRDARASARSARLDAACRAIAGLLIDAAGVRVQATDAAAKAQAERLETRLRAREQQCVDTLLDSFRFPADIWQASALPLSEGRWQQDLFDPETARALGIRTGSSAAAGAAAGFGVDALTGGLSLGAGTLIGAGIGASWETGSHFGSRALARWRGHILLRTEASTLALLAQRQLALLAALLRRGHAAQTPLRPAADARGWPSKDIRQLCLRARAHPDWSCLNAPSAAAPRRVVNQLMTSLRAALPRTGEYDAGSRPHGDSGVAPASAD